MTKRNIWTVFLYDFPNVYNMDKTVWYTPYRMRISRAKTPILRIDRQSTVFQTEWFLQNYKCDQRKFYTIVLGY